MRVALPHSLPRDELRRRLRERANEFAAFIPGGFAVMNTSWPTEDRMEFTITALARQIAASIELEDRQLLVSITLPVGLAFAEGAIEEAVARKGRKLLA